MGLMFTTTQEHLIPILHRLLKGHCIIIVVGVGIQQTVHGQLPTQVQAIPRIIFQRLQMKDQAMEALVLA